MHARSLMRISQRTLLLFAAILSVVTSILIFNNDTSAQATNQQCYEKYDGGTFANGDIDQCVTNNFCSAQRQPNPMSGGGSMYRYSCPRPEYVTMPFDQMESKKQAMIDIYSSAVTSAVCAQVENQFRSSCTSFYPNAVSYCLNQFFNNGYEGSSSVTFPSIDTAVVARCINNQGGAPYELVFTTLEENQQNAVNAANNTSLNVDGTTGEDAGSNCMVEGGQGWLLCPMLNTVASLNDWSFSLIQYFLRTPPLLMLDGSGNVSGVYTAWSSVRSVANVLLVLVFLVIIFSQITSVGITNYGIKKIFPKLIIGAILINTSFWLAAGAIDISNVVGSSVYKLLADGNISTPVVDPGSSPVSNIPSGRDPSGIGTFMAITTLVLGGTTIAVMAGTAVLLPLALSALFMFVGLVFVLTFRHAMIFILVVAAPIAIVAYMLPNTEGTFKTWFKTLRVLLYIYPAIAFIMGVSTTAAGITFAAANQMDDKMGQFIMQLIAVAMPAMGIFAGIMLAKTMGSVMGKLGINNPLGGAMNAAKQRAGAFGERRDKTRAAAHMNNGNFIRRNTLGRRGGQRAKMIGGMKDQAADAQLQAATLGTNAGRNAFRAQGGAQQTLSSAKSAAEIDELKYNKELHLNAAVDNLRLDAAKTQLNAELNEEAAREGSVANSASNEKFLQGMRADSAAKELQSNQVGQLLEKDDSGNYTAKAREWQGTATGIGNNERVLAGAIASRDKETSESINNRIALMQDKYSASELVAKAENDLITSHSNGDSIGARAATQILGRNTGSAGVAALERATENMDLNRAKAEAAGDVNAVAKMDEVMGGVKYDISGSGMKAKSRTLDLYSTDNANRSFNTILNDSKTAAGLNQTELAGQTTQSLEAWSGAGTITPEQAQRVLDSHSRGTLPLDEKKLGIFEAISKRPPSTPPPATP